jgi:hypothetical protein
VLLNSGKFDMMHIQNASLAGELFIWLSSGLSSDEIKPFHS